MALNFCAWMGILDGLSQETQEKAKNVNLAFGPSNGTPLQYSCLENPTDGGAWWATVHGVAKSQTRLSDLTSLDFKSFKVK